jgi:hypothetical protein
LKWAAFQPPVVIWVLSFCLAKAPSFLSHGLEILGLGEFSDSLDGGTQDAISSLQKRLGAFPMFIPKACTSPLSYILLLLHCTIYS